MSALEAQAAERGAGRRRRRLEHVDAMRPVKQFGVVSTHAVAFFPPALAIAGGMSMVLTEVTRFAFMFISAAMLVYAYPRIDRGNLLVFWRRRLVAIGLPYLVWTLVYFCLQYFALQAGSVSSPLDGLEKFGYLLATGYYQLYFLLLLLEFCLVFPLFLWLLRRTEGHHLALLLASFGLQLVLTSLIYWSVEPAWFLGAGAGMLEVWNYQLFLVAGGLLAWHYREVHAWLCRKWRLVLAMTALSAVVGEGFYSYAEAHPASVLAGGVVSAAFQPATVPFYLGLTACVYLLGVAMVAPARSRLVRWAARAGADNSYGIYLSQILFFNVLVWAGWRDLSGTLPWPLYTYGSAVVVFAAAAALTSVLARLPGAKALAGRSRVRRRPVLEPVSAPVPPALAREAA